MLGLPYRQDVIERLKDPWRSAIMKITEHGGTLIAFKATWRMFRICRLYPVPTRENCHKPNTLVFLDLRDWFFSHMRFRVTMFLGVWNMFINVYEHAWEYSSIVDTLVARSVEVYWYRLQNSPTPRKRFWRQDE